MLLKCANFLTAHLPRLVILAGALGYIFSPASSFLSPATPFLLAVMIAGSGLTLSLRDVLDWKGTVRLSTVALALQLSFLPVFGWVLYLVLPGTPLRFGMLALGVAPSEITSTLMTFLGRGNLAFATRLMAISIFVSTFLAPLWLAVFLGKSASFDFTGVVLELGLVIALPFILASGLRTRYNRLAGYETEAGGVSALAVILLIFVVGGSIADFTVKPGVAWGGLACLVFNLGAICWGLGFRFFQNVTLPRGWPWYLQAGCESSELRPRWR